MSPAPDMGHHSGFLRSLGSALKYLEQYRPLLALWPFFWRIVLLPTLLLAGLFFVPDRAGLPVAFQWCGLTVALVILQSWRHLWAWRFAWRVRGFHTLCGSRIALYFAPRLQDRGDCSELLRRCEEELDELSRQFGF